MNRRHFDQIGFLDWPDPESGQPSYPGPSLYYICTAFVLHLHLYCTTSALHLYYNCTASDSVLHLYCISIASGRSSSIASIDSFFFPNKKFILFERMGFGRCGQFYSFSEELSAHLRFQKKSFVFFSIFRVSRGPQRQFVSGKPLFSRKSNSKTATNINRKYHQIGT